MQVATLGAMRFGFSLRSTLVAVALSATALTVPAQDTPRFHGDRPNTFEIRNVHVVRGDGAPAQGPTSVFVRDGRIVRDVIEKPKVVIDGTGHYVLPGLISTHAHLQTQSGGVPIDIDYHFKLWLASGITTVREVSGTPAQMVPLRSRSAKGDLVAPRIFVYPMFGPCDSIADAGRRVRALKSAGADGIKLWSNLNYRTDVVAEILRAAQNEKLPVTAHIGIGESNALTYGRAGLTSIEHWYGIPDAALDGVQQFPPEFSYSNEVDRFRYAGRLWREVNDEKLDQVLLELADLDVTWSPTLAVYEASRDLMRAQNKPHFDEYLHPAFERFFKPSLESHGSYFIGWSTTDETYWKENYRLWMRALRRFSEFGGNITTGEDAGYIYLLQGFGLVRELELHHEAGFHPLEVIRHATYNGAKVLGMENEFGRVLPGLAADLIVVRGNPLQNLKCLYPTGCDIYVDGEVKPTGGVAFTIKDGRIYHGPTLAREVRELVESARERARGDGR